MRDSFTKVLSLINSLDKSQLLSLNKIIVTLVKQIELQEKVEKATGFKIGELVYFSDEHQRKWSGMVFKINAATIQIMTANSQKFNVNPSILQPELKPSKKLLELKKLLATSLGFLKN